MTTDGTFNLEVFSSKSTKNKNASTNLEREKILVEIFSIEIRKLTKEELAFREKWISFLKTHVTNGDNILKIEHYGGRGNNFDFLLTTEIASMKLEFKFGTTPQDIQVYCNKDISCSDLFKYPEYYYNNVLVKLDLPCIRPSLSEYMVDIYKTTPSLTKYPEFYDYLKSHKTQIQTNVKNSITQFLTTYGNLVDTVKVGNMLTEKLCSKTTVKYDFKKKEFILLGKPCNGKFDDLVFSHIKNGNTIVLTNDRCTVNMLLRWKNHNGVLGPAWQIKVV
jgi:hypothetical protein